MFSRKFFNERVILKYIPHSRLNDVSDNHYKVIMTKRHSNHSQLDFKFCRGYRCFSMPLFKINQCWWRTCCWIYTTRSGDWWSNLFDDYCTRSSGGFNQCRNYPESQFRRRSWCKVSAVNKIKYKRLLILNLKFCELFQD